MCASAKCATPPHRSASRSQVRPARPDMRVVRAPALPRIRSSSVRALSRERAPDAIAIGCRELEQRGNHCTRAQGKRSQRAKQRCRHRCSAACCNRCDNGKDADRRLECAVIGRYRCLVYRPVHARLLLLGQRGQRSAQRGREKGNASLDAGPLLSRSSQATCHRARTGLKAVQSLAKFAHIGTFAASFLQIAADACSFRRAGADGTNALEEPGSDSGAVAGRGTAK